MEDGKKAAENVKVFVRVRPTSDREAKSGATGCVEVNEETGTIVINTKPEPKMFTYDHVAGGDSAQEGVFERVGKPISDTCLAGYNGTIFAYGQTGSGKTHTIQGPSVSDPTQRGVMPRVFDYICSQMAREQRKAGAKLSYLCKVSFMEIYNERVYDLLEPHSESLNMREDSRRGVFVDNITETTINNADDCLQVMRTGIANRRVGETAMNRESSRSHSVFCLDIESTEKRDGMTIKKHSRFNLIDLAGSERQKSTEAAGSRLKEASTINKSLSALGNVIMSLVAESRTGKTRHVHYRDSKLTFLLRDSLGGNSLTYIIACISPSDDAFGETMSTLKFAQRAKLIKNKAVVNENNSGSMMVVMAENEKLKSMIRQLEALQSANSRRMSLSFVHPMPGSPLVTDCFTPQKKASSAALEASSTSAPGVAAGVLEGMVAQGLAREKQWLQENEALAKKVKDMETLVKKHERHVQSHALVLKLRDAATAQMKEVVKGKVGTDVFVHDEVARLEQQVVQLTQQMEHHPTILAKTVAITALTDEVAALEAKLAAGAVTNQHSSGALTEQYQLSQELMDLRHEKSQLGSQLSEMQETLRSPRKLLNKLSSPQKKSFESLELRKWEAQQGFEDQIARLKTELADTNDEAIAAAAQLADLGKEKNELMLMIKALQLTNDEHRASAEATKLRHQMEMERAAELRAESERAVRESYELTISQVEEGLEQAQSGMLEVAVLTGKLSALEKEHARLNEQFEASDSQVARLTQQLVQAQASLATADTEHANAAQAMSEEIAELRAAVANGASAAAGYQQQLEAMQSQLEESRSGLADLEQRHKRVSEEKLDLTQQLGEATNESDRLAQLLDNVNKQLERLTSNNEMLEEDHETLLESFAYQETANVEAKAVITALQKEIQALEMEKARLADAASSSEKLREELRTLMSEQSDVAQNIASLVADKQELQETISVHEVTIEELSDAVENAKSEIDNLRGKLAKAADDEELAAEDLVIMTNAFTSLQTKAHAKEKDFERVVCELDVMRVAMQSLRTNFALKEDEVIALQEELVEAEQVEALTQDIHKHELDGLTKRLTQEADRARGLQAELNRAYQELERKEAEHHESLAMQETDMLSMMAAHEADVQAVSDVLTSLRAEHEKELLAWEMRMATEEEAKAQHRLIVQQLKQALADANSNYAALRKENGVLAKRTKGAAELLATLRAHALGEDSAEAAASLQILDAVERQVLADLRSASGFGEGGAEPEDDGVESMMKGLVQANIANQAQVRELADVVEAKKREITALRMQADTVRSDTRAREETFARLSSEWEVIQQAKACEIDQLQKQVCSLRDEQAVLLATHAEALQSAVSQDQLKEAQRALEQQRGQFEEKQAKLISQLKSTQTLLEQHAQDADLQTFEAARLAASNKNLSEKLRLSLLAKAQLSQDMEQYKHEEERTHREKEEVKRQLAQVEAQRDSLQTEFDKLMPELTEAKKQLAKLIGHHNHKQKIQHHMKIKQENDALKRDKITMERTVRALQAKLKVAGVDVSDKLDKLVEGDKENIDDSERLKAQNKKLQEQMSLLTSAITKAAASKAVTSGEPAPDRRKTLAIPSFRRATFAPGDIESREKGGEGEGGGVDSALQGITSILDALKREHDTNETLQRELLESRREMKLKENMGRLAAERQLLDSLDGMLDDDNEEAFVDGTEMFS